MGVYIKGMEMPKSCDECRIMMFEDTNCSPELYCGCPIVFMAHPQGVGHRPDYCPLVPVPPHGDLIDRDAVYKAINDARKEDPLLADVYVDDYVIVSDWLRNAPTIIPASEEGE